MKKTITLLLILLSLSVAGAGNITSGQSSVLGPGNYFQPFAPPVQPMEEVPTGPYLTHPEFIEIMMTTTVTPAQNTDDGYIFVTPRTQQSGSVEPVIMIIDNEGEPIYIRLIPLNKFAGDFKVQTVNGTDFLTYHAGILPSGYSFGSSYVLNDKYELVDTWTMDVGSGSDIHEFLLLENGHAILMAYVPTPFDLSPYGGPVNGTILDIVLQEQDENHNVIFEWHASDHMPIGDSQIDLNSAAPVDYLHTNGIEVDDDGNWLLSHRHFSEITKIDRTTGEIIWRLGGPGNEFTFTNDIGFYNQHHIVRLDNGNISLFDNGNQHNPPHSRAVEYAIDEVAKTITRVWAYPDNTNIFSSAMGNFQRLPNGNSFIGWGTVPQFTEVESDGTVVHEMLMSTPSYRVFRFPWEAAPAAAPRGVLVHDADPTAVTIYTSWNGATDIVSYDVFAGPTLNNLTFAANAGRTGFETEIKLDLLPSDTCFFQTQPIHAQANPTPRSNIMYRLDLPVCWDQLEHSYLPVTNK